MNIKATLSFAAVSLFAVSSLQAATISWSAKTAPTSGTNAAGKIGPILNTGLFAASGAAISAVNLGSTETVTFDGVTFAGMSSTTAAPLNSGSFSTTTNVNSTTAQHDATSGTLTNNVIWASSTTFTLNALVPGTEYRLQALIFDGRSAYNGRTATADGTSFGVYNLATAGDYGPGMLLTGVFTADAITQNFKIDVFTGATNSGLHMSALALHAVPEPSAIMLSALGSLALLGRRRRA